LLISAKIAVGLPQVFLLVKAISSKERKFVHLVYQLQVLRIVELLRTSFGYNAGIDNRLPGPPKECKYGWKDRRYEVSDAILFFVRIFFLRVIRIKQRHFSSARILKMTVKTKRNAVFQITQKQFFNC
jgi:hypothetical protein